MFHLHKAGLGLAAVLAFALGAAHTAGAQTLWYNGDFNGVDGVANEVNTIVLKSKVYDDFVVPVGSPWQVTSVFSNNQISGFIPTLAQWEIRSGVSDGNGGTLISSGSGAATETPTGRTAFGMAEETISIDIPTVTLMPGVYWLAVTPIGEGSGRSFLSTTSGANAVGSPAGNNGGSFVDSATFGVNFAPATAVVGPGVLDFSMGVRGTASVPEPGAVALFLATGGAGTLIGGMRLLRRK